MKVPRLGVELELQLPAYTTATATLGPQPTEQGQGWNPGMESASSWILVRFVSTAPQRESPEGEFLRACLEILAGEPPYAVGAEGPAWSSHHGAAETNLTRNHEVAGSIPGLTHWVRDLALP